MASKKEQAAQDQRHAIETLRLLLPPGSSVSTVLVHVSRSGMFRVIKPVITAADGEPFDITWHVRQAGIGVSPRNRYGVGMSGCGMDMGFALVYELSHALYPNGFPCTGERCPSNDHSNGDRDYTPGRTHNSGGYALRHRWL